jgi:hypothetical protein
MLVNTVIQALPKHSSHAWTQKGLVRLFAEQLPLEKSNIVLAILETSIADVKKQMKKTTLYLAAHTHDCFDAEVVGNGG